MKGPLCNKVVFLSLIPNSPNTASVFDQLEKIIFPTKWTFKEGVLHVKGREESDLKFDSRDMIG